MKRRLSWAALAFAVSLAPPAAEACPNGAEFRVDPTVQAVSTAEAASARGDQRAALSLLLAQTPQLVSGGPGVSTIGDRAVRVAARAVIRSNGEVSPTAAKGAEGRMRDIAWATGVMRSLSAKGPTDPENATDLGEALARDPAQRTEALRLLEGLESSSTMTSPFGYVALARLREDPAPGAPALVASPLATMNRASRAVDILRCKALSKERGVCGEPRAQPAAKG